MTATVAGVGRLKRVVRSRGRRLGDMSAIQEKGQSCVGDLTMNALEAKSECGYEPLTDEVVRVKVLVLLQFNERRGCERSRPTRSEEYAGCSSDEDDGTGIKEASSSIAASEEEKSGTPAESEVGEK